MIEQEVEPGTTVEYVPGARGYAVFVIGTDTHGAEAVAIWTLSTFGAATGAWVLPLAELDSSRLLPIVDNMVRGRCLVGWTAEGAVEALDKIEAVLPAGLVTRLRAASLSVPDLVAEIREHRTRDAKAVEEYNATATTKGAPLKWARELPDEGDEPAALRPRQITAAYPAAAAALHLVEAVRQVIGLWQNTEEARCRRSYLRQRFGEQQPLPPRWVARLRAGESGTEG